MSPKQKYVSLKEAAEVLDVSYENLRRMIQSSRFIIPGTIKIGRVWRVPLKSLTQLRREQNEDEG